MKVPLVTREEKAKRRRKRGPKRPGTPPRRMHRGADNAYKEFKIATFYDSSNTHRQVVATAGDHRALGRLVRRQAIGLGLNQFDQKVAIADVGKRLDQCDYPRYLREGWQIGSGPTEAMCKVLTYRLKGSGMRWDRQGAEPMMALVA